MNVRQQKLLISIYRRQTLVVDKLHHTPEFISMCGEFNARQRVGFTQHDIYAELLKMRKNKMLPKKTNNKVRQPKKKVIQGSLFDEDRS